MSAALLIGAFGAVTVGSTDVSAAPAAVVLDEGEIDFAPRIVDGRLQLQIADRTADSGPVWREPSEVVLHAKPETEYFVDGPMIDPVAMFDAVPGDPAWLLNGVESQLRFDLDPGWSTGQLPGDAAGATEVRLKEVRGPGQFAMFDWDYANGENAVPYLVQRLPEYHSFTLPPTDGTGDRFAPMWGFLAEGVHRITFEVSTTVGGERTTDTETVAVAVGDDVDPGQVLPGDGSTPPVSPPPPSTTTAPPTDTAVIGEGHVDLAARMAGDRLRFQLKEGSSADFTVHEPDEAVLHVKPRAKRRLGEGLEFIGGPDDTVWVLPQTQTNGLLWLGFGSTELDTAEVTELSYELSALRGPGHIAVYEGSSLGGVTTHFNSADGLPDRYPYGANRHTHATWVFTEEGVYRVTLTVRATLASGEKVSDTGTVAVAVGEADPSTVVPGEGDGGEPTATPTATGSATSSARPTGSAAPTPTDTATVTPGDSPSASATGSFAPPGPGSGSGGGDGASTSGGLASTGAGVTVPLAVAAAAVAVGAAAVVAVRRRHTSGVTDAS
ncbi:choice-of-anchor M domain-containing protein [Streptomyces jeddahensis]|uniref:choice-of-anchor M domain-containing protein n=1 Tax=Streptomyces jeddahensis TaxID=1716141 RepID=UPI00082F26B7|nr:choice-of-anchor M domain-containing protein [Streptomyces jeddahensis]